jgi:hypothetical protein
MKKVFSIFACLFLAVAFSTPAFAEEDVEKDETVVETEKPKWTSAIQQKYSYTDEQMKTLTDSGLNHAQMAKAAALSSKSGKTLDEVLKMRTEQKMGWGKIAKELGVHPSEIGKGVSSLRHEMNAERKADRQAKQAEKKAEHAAGKKKH